MDILPYQIARRNWGTAPAPFAAYCTRSILVRWAFCDRSDASRSRRGKIGTCRTCCSRGSEKDIVAWSVSDQISAEKKSLLEKFHFKWSWDCSPPHLTMDYTLSQGLRKTYYRAAISTTPNSPNGVANLRYLPGNRLKNKSTSDVYMPKAIT